MSNVYNLKTVSQQELEARARRGIVLVVDDDPSIRSAYQRLFEFEGFFCVAYENAEAFLLRYSEATGALEGPRCALCDISLPGMSGLELQREMGDEQNLMPFIFMSGVSTEVEVIQAYREGGHAFMLKPVDVEELIDTIRSALTLSASRYKAESEMAEISGLVTRLTEREKAVIRLVLQGLTNPQISEQLHIALRTVKVHRQHAMEKLGVSNLVELTRLADRSPLL